MKRHAEEALLAWFKKKNRMPLIIRGARQVGKSTLVRLFCENNKIDLLEINLETTRLKTVEQSDFHLESILDEIQLKTKKLLTPTTLVFFDEIQESPKLLKALRYFFELRPDIAVVAAGSLLELVLNEKNFSFPVGRVEFFHLGPMSFSEFLYATDNQQLVKKLDELDFSPYVDSLLKQELIKFYYVGGMPKAVKTYVESKSLVPVREIQNQILQTYMADFPKYNSKIDVRRIERIFAASAIHIGKKIIYQKLDPTSQSRDIKRIVELLIDARVLLPCFHTNANTVPLLGESDSGIMKLFFLDIGLLNALLSLDFDIIDNEFRNNFNTKGILAEQFIAQHLAYAESITVPPQLFYWLKDKGTQKGEIDFIIAKNDVIIPVEVKSTSTGHLKSLFYFIKEKKREFGIKFSLAPFSKELANHQIENKTISFTLINIPHYAVEKIDSIWKSVSKS